MHLIQMLLPLNDNAGQRFSRADFDLVRQELTQRFGGVTAFLRTPAEGLWQEAGATSHDELVMIEVMASTLDFRWWGQYKEALQRRFRQDEIVIRAIAIETL